MKTYSVKTPAVGSITLFVKDNGAHPLPSPLKEWLTQSGWDGHVDFQVSSLDSAELDRLELVPGEFQSNPSLSLPLAEPEDLKAAFRLTQMWVEEILPKDIFKV